MTAPVLFLGGALARIAESPSGAATSFSASLTDPHVGTGGSTTTTTTEPRGGAVDVSPGTSSQNTQSIGESVNAGPAVTDSSGTTVSTVGAVQQTISMSVLPGPLTITPSTETISFTKAHGQGGGGPKAGTLPTVTVDDATGSLAGWTATISLQSVDGLSAKDLARAKLCLTPDTPIVVGGNPTEVKVGKSSCGSVGDALTLFYAPPNGGGGTFTDTGSLTLNLPGAPTKAPVTATLAVAVN